jgi:regulation of enolase protein 1 (concanavalin A-like superfamily)
MQQQIGVISLVTNKNVDFWRYFTHYAMDNGSINNLSFFEAEIFLLFSATMYPTS